MQGTGTTPDAAVSPAASFAPFASFAAHRQRAVATVFPIAAAAIAALTATYAFVDIIRGAGGGQMITYAMEISVPLVALFLTRRNLWGNAEAIALTTDLIFTAILAGRLLLPATTESGTVLFLSVKLLTTAALFPWHPILQFISALGTLLLYYLAIELSGRGLNATHQLVGPFIAAALSCIGSAVADHTRRTLWQQSADLAASEQRTRSLLEAERVLAAVAREVSVVTDLSTALERLNSLTAAVLGCDISNTYLLDDDRGRMFAAATNVTDPELRARLLQDYRPVSAPIVGELLRGKTIVIDDVAAQPWFTSAELEGVRCFAMAPIIAKGKILGVLTSARFSGAPFDERQVSLLTAIAAQAGIVVENARLFDSLREANRLQAEFVANMSHELRTPLNVIIGYVSLLTDELRLPAESGGQFFLQRIAAAGRALHRLVESVLEYARLDRGRAPLLATQFPAAKLLGELRELCDDLDTGPDLRIAIDDGTDIQFISDYNRLYSILSNLLLNAIKFTASGTVELRLRAIGTDAEFTVRDTGIGMDADALAHVFEPFRQVDGSPTRLYGGVGLGLAIVQRNAQLLSGRVELESTPGAGTTVRVRIPLAIEDALIVDRSGPRGSRHGFAPTPPPPTSS